MAVTTKIQYNGAIYDSIKDACRAADLNYNTLMTYVTKKKLPASEVFNRMIERRQSGRVRVRQRDTSVAVELPEGYINIRQACMGVGADYIAVHNRLKKGMSFEEAVSDSVNVKRRKSRLSAKDLGLPITLNDIVCETIAEVAAVLGITGTALSYHIKTNNCSVQEAIEHYQQEGARLTGRRSSSLAASHIAYTGTDGKRYFYAICRQCSAVVLVAEDMALSFEHGVMCSTYDVPASFVVPSILAKLRKQCSRQVGGEDTNASDEFE